MTLITLFAYGEAVVHVLLAAGAIAALRILGIRRWRVVLQAAGTIKIAQELAAALAAVALGRPLERSAETLAWTALGATAVIVSRVRIPAREPVPAERE